MVWWFLQNPLASDFWGTFRTTCLHLWSNAKNTRREAISTGLRLVYSKLHMQITFAHHTLDPEQTTSKTNIKPTVDQRAYGLYCCRERWLPVVIWATPGWKTPTWDVHRLCSDMRVLPEWPFTSFSAHVPHIDTKVRTRSWISGAEAHTNCIRVEKQVERN